MRFWIFPAIFLALGGHFLPGYGWGQSRDGPSGRVTYDYLADVIEFVERHGQE